MSVYRTYFSKNNTLIEDNLTNNSQNPVTEIAYGTLTSEVTRFIFDIDLTSLQNRINEGIINADRIQSHTLKLVNTIRFDEKYLGKKTYDGITQRASSFDLEVFNIEEEWDEGSGYEFVYEEEAYPLVSTGASNWLDATTTSGWTSEGAYSTGSTIIGQQHFEKGNENLEIDVTDYINYRLGLTTLSGVTGTTGLGIKYTDEFEALETLYRQAVAFFAKTTHTFFEPCIETQYDDLIEDDRNNFYLDKDNQLYLYANLGANPTNVTVNSVEIIDYLGQTVETISGSSIENITKGVYKIDVNIDSATYPDAVIFTDRWNVTIGTREKTVDQEFYLITDDNYFNFDLGNRINFDNYFFSFVGIKEGEKIKDTELRRIEVDVKQLYPNQNNDIPLEVEYRLYNSQTSDHQFDVIPWTKLNRTFKGYEFLLDFSWLIPQDYTIELRLINGNTFKLKEPLKFTVVSDGITTPSDFGLTTTTTTSTTTTTTTLPPTTTTTTTVAPNPPIFMSFTPQSAVGTYTNTDTLVGNNALFELLWTTDGNQTQDYAGTPFGLPLNSNTTLQVDFVSSGGSYFELTTATGLTTGGSSAVISNGTLNINLSAGDKNGYLEIRVRNSGATIAGFTIDVNNSLDPTQEMGVVSGATDVEYDTRFNAGTTYGYIDITPTNNTVFQSVNT